MWHVDIGITFIWGSENVPQKGAVTVVYNLASSSTYLNKSNLQVRRTFYDKHF